MDSVISTERIPIKMWVTEPDEGTIKQAKNLANLPFAFKHISLMPDAHVGYGMPIGGVLATKAVIIPNAVGVDIGCGMCAVQTSHEGISLEDLKKIMSLIRAAVPVGFNHHKEKQTGHVPDFPVDDFGVNTPVIKAERERAQYQVGTLGGGNHFIEIQKGSDGRVWVMIHSGSRNLGLKVANYYNDIAKEKNSAWYSGVDPKWDLAFLPSKTLDGESYLAEMKYCVDFALANRRLMMERILESIRTVVGGTHGHIINIAHNYVALENHFGENVFVHRKGATAAAEGQIGIIPGSQGTKSYIVSGKGNAESFQSCSHGAGRLLGRKEAQRTLNLEAEQKALDEKGIIHSVRNTSDLDEAPGAYKDIDMVMENQKDLVEKMVELTPLAVIKG